MPRTVDSAFGSIDGGTRTTCPTGPSFSASIAANADTLNDFSASIHPDVGDFMTIGREVWGNDLPGLSELNSAN